MPREKIKELTERQRELLEFVEKSVSYEKRMPSFREMAKAMKVSAVGTIQDLVRALKDKGFLEQEGRHIKLASSRSSAAVSIPILGVVAAGPLTDAWQVSLGSFSLSPDQVPSKHPEKCFALRIKGESMIDAGILEKDLIVVDPTGRPRNGDFVVASVNGEATVKEISYPKKGKSLELIPHNRRMKAIRIENSDEIQIHGKVVAVHRYFN
jgi:repressor LexA